MAKEQPSVQLPAPRTMINKTSAVTFGDTRPTWAPGAVEPDICVINDVVLRISPTNITIDKRSNNHEWQTLRTRSSQKMKSGHSTANVTLQLVFEQKDFFTRLQPLIAGLRATPFAAVHNAHIERQLKTLDVEYQHSETTQTVEAQAASFQPVVLALQEASFSTNGHSGQPSTITATLNFMWFNYHPFTPYWAYATGENSSTPGYAWNSPLWKAFYKPYLYYGSPPLFLPHGGGPPALEPHPPTIFSWREYAIVAKGDNFAYQLAAEVIQAIKDDPYQFVLSGKEAIEGGTDVDLNYGSANIPDLLVRQAADNTHRVINRFGLEKAKGVIREGTGAGASSVVDKMLYGPLSKSFRIASESGVEAGVKYLQGIGARQLDNALQIVKKKAQQSEKKTSALPSGSVGEEDFQPVKKSVAKYPSVNDNAIVGELVLMGRRAKLRVSPQEDIAKMGSGSSTVIERITFSFSNNLAVIPMAGYRYPTIQHIGSTAVNVSMSINATNDGARKFHRMYDVIESMALRFRQVPQPFLNLRISNDFLGIFGVQEFVTEGIATTTIVGSPGRTHLELRLSDAGVTSQDKLRDDEAITQENVQLFEDINKSIWKKMRSNMVFTGYKAFGNNLLVGSSTGAGPDLVTPPKNKKAYYYFVDFAAKAYTKLIRQATKGTSTEIQGNLEDIRWAALSSTYGYIPGHDDMIKDLMGAANQPRPSGDERNVGKNYAAQDAALAKKARARQAVDSKYAGVERSKKTKLRKEEQDGSRVENLNDMGMDTYLRTMRALFTKISQNYLVLDEFAHIKEEKDRLGLGRGLPAYPDFEPSIQECLTLLNGSGEPNGGKDEWSVQSLHDVDPDVYMWYPVYSKNASDVSLIDPKYTDHAAKIGIDMYNQAATSVSKFYTTRYKDAMKSSSLPHLVPGHSGGNVPANLRTPILDGVKGPYPSALTQETINKSLVMDPGGKAHSSIVPLKDKGTQMTAGGACQHNPSPIAWAKGITHGGKSLPTTGTAPDTPKTKIDPKDLPKGKDGKPVATYGWIPGWPVMVGTHASRTQNFRVKPDTIVIHSGGVGAGVAEYMAGPLRRPVITHFSWSTTYNGLAQQMSLYNSGWHAAGSTFLGQGNVNSRSIGIEMPGPWKGQRSDHQRKEIQTLVVALKQAMPSLKYWTRHSDIRATKNDPGPGFKNSWMDGFGLEWKGKTGTGQKPATVSGGKKTASTSKSPKSTSQTSAADSGGTDQSPYKKALASYEQSLLRGQGQSLMRAYPTFKLYFIEDDGGNERKRLAYDDFFSYNSLQSIRIIRSRKIAADLCEIYVTNVSGILTNRKFAGQRSKDGKKDMSAVPRSADGKPVTENKNKAGTAGENPMASMLLQEGQNISLRMGYSNDPDKLTRVFNGAITGIEMSESEDIIRIVAQSYATELCRDIKGIEEPKTYNSSTFFGWDAWGLADGASTARILEEIMSEPELVHFGRWDAGSTDTPNRGLLTDKFQWNKRPQDDNMFPPPAASEVDTLGNGWFKSDMSYVIFQTTIWDIIQEMCMRHPNYIASLVPYSDQTGERMTFFFGLPEQLYFARYPKTGEQQKQDKLKNTEKEIKNKQAKARTELGQASYESSSNIPRALFGSDEGAKKREDRLKAAKAQANNVGLNQPGGIPRLIREMQLAQALEDGYIKPFRDYHLLTSDQHIISNNIRANSRDVANTIAVKYRPLGQKLPDVGFFGPISKDKNKRTARGPEKTVVVKLDNALPTEEIRTQVGSFVNVYNEALAERYGLSMLLQNCKDIYKGGITIIGNPDIKPFDVCYIYDDYSDMVGPVEVEQVVHVFDQQQGFRTEIKPDMLCYANHWGTMSTVAIMGHVMEAIKKDIFGEETSRYAPFSNMVGQGVTAWGGFLTDMLITYTPQGHPISMLPLTVHGRPLSGGVPIRKIPTSLWENVFGKWSAKWDAHFDDWWEDTTDDMVNAAKGGLGFNAVGTFLSDV